MIKKLLNTIFDNEEKRERERLRKNLCLEIALKEAKMILSEHPSPLMHCKNKYANNWLSTPKITDNLHLLRQTPMWQRGFIQAIYDTHMGSQIAIKQEFLRIFSKNLYTLTFSVDKKSIEQALWNLGYASYAEFKIKGTMPM